MRSPSPENLPHESYFSTREQPPLWHSIREIVKSDPNFNWFLGARTLVQFGTMAFSFYTVYAASHLMAGAYTVGVLTSILMVTQVATNLLLGWLADRWSRKGVLEIGAAAIFLSAIIARFAPNITWMYPVMILTAIANTAFWTISMAMTLEFGGEKDRPTYVGMANSFIAPATIVAPPGGRLAGRFGRLPGHLPVRRHRWPGRSFSVPLLRLRSKKAQTLFHASGRRITDP